MASLVSYSMAPLVDTTRTLLAATASMILPDFPDPQLQPIKKFSDYLYASFSKN